MPGEDVTQDRRDSMVLLSGGRIVLLDEGTKRTWSVDLQPFMVSRFTVTEEQYRRVTAPAALSAVRPRAPIVDVSWLDAVRFCNALSVLEGLIPLYSGTDDPEGLDVVQGASDGYRLPTEAEWEFACRAGTNGTRYGDLDAIAWHRGNSSEELHDVGERRPNDWGLHDMIGNVWEWCWDVFDPASYGPYRVFRGGGFADGEAACRASARRKSHPQFKMDDLGFRVARSTLRTR